MQESLTNKRLGSREKENKAHARRSAGRLGLNKLKCINAHILSPRILRLINTMYRIIMLCLVAMSSLIAAAQGSVKGKIIDRQSNEALQFVNIKVSQAKTGKMVKGSVTDGGGAFNITGLADGDYVLEASYIG